MNLKSWDEESLRPTIEVLFRNSDPAKMVFKTISKDGEGLAFRGMDAPSWDSSGYLDTSIGRIAVIAVGKAAPSMMEGALRALMTSGVKVSGPLLCISSLSVPPDKKVPGVHYLQGEHPLPGPKTTSNINVLIDLISGLGKDDTVIFLLSGGASSLTFSPVSGLDPSLKSRTIKRALLSGAAIGELNIIRRALSLTKGGGILDSFRGRGWVTLAISDVMTDDPRFVGSGLSYPWKVGSDELRNILTKYVLHRTEIDELLDIAGRNMGRPIGTGSMYLRNIMVANNGTASEALSNELKVRGLTVVRADDRFTSEALPTARALLDRARAMTGPKGSDAFVMGGETTVKVKGKGRGGRCSEMALSVLPLLEDGETAAFLTTDGVDGNWDGGGAIVRKCGLDRDVIVRYLEDNDSGSFFDRFGGKVDIGPTGNNLGDLFLFIRGGFTLW
ncbi:MAG: DUF4147 domain-containing protein [Candidatus Thermoplasmatota archaeon]|nr:DUF4147 domain-containing protein [Candidatus Thermoplasmatota archaeon]